MYERNLQHCNLAHLHQKEKISVTHTVMRERFNVFNRRAWILVFLFCFHCDTVRNITFYSSKWLLFHDTAAQPLLLCLSLFSISVSLLDNIAAGRILTVFKLKSEYPPYVLKCRLAIREDSRMADPFKVELAATHRASIFWSLISGGCLASHPRPAQTAPQSGTQLVRLGQIIWIMRGDTSHSPPFGLILIFFF